MKQGGCELPGLVCFVVFFGCVEFKKQGKCSREEKRRKEGRKEGDLMFLFLCCFERVRYMLSS
jgi:hypothetical protein